MTFEVFVKEYIQKYFKNQLHDSLQDGKNKD